MKILFSIVSFIGFISSVWAETPPRTDEQLFAALSKRTGIKVESIEFFRVAPANDAWTVFAFLNSHPPSDGKELQKKAGRAIAENPEVEKYVTEGMAKLPYNFNNDDQRGYFLRPLGYVPTPWSMRLLGHYLIDETPMIMPKELPDDYGTYENSDFAIRGLQRMGFSDAPPENPYGLIPEVKQAWRQWWKANEGRVEQRIYEINPGYVPPQMQQPVSATPIPTPISTPQVAPVTPPRATPKPIATPLARATPAIVVPVNRSNLFIYIIGTVLALGILFAVIKVFRK